MRFRTGSTLRLLAHRNRYTLRCSFCGKLETEVKKLIAGPKVCICNECIDICNEIIAGRDISGRPVTNPNK